MKDLKITFVQDGKEQVREFDTLMDYFLDVEKVTEKNDKGEDEEVPAKDELGRHNYLNIKYVIDAE